MAMKRILTKEEHTALPSLLKQEYKAEGEGFVLDLTDYDDGAALKKAKDAEVAERRKVEQRAKALDEELQTLKTEREEMLKGNIPKGDVEKLELSWKEKLAAKEKALKDKLDAANASLQTLLVDNVAQSIAARISTAPALIMPHLKNRLRAVQGEDGTFATKVVDAAGKPSALTVEELEKEFCLNPEYKAVITGSKASGGGAGGAAGGGGAASGKIDWNQSPKDIAAGLKANGRLREPTGT